MSALSYSEESVVLMHIVLPSELSRIYEDLLGALCQFERPGRLLHVGRFFGDLLLEGGEFPGGNDCRGMIVALDLALIGALEGADDDDPAWARHLQL